MKSILISLFFLTACTTQTNIPKIPVIYVNDWQEKWKEGVLQECKHESVVMTLLLFEAKGRIWSEQDIKDVGKFLMDNCVYNKNITI